MKAPTLNINSWRGWFWLFIGLAIGRLIGQWLVNIVEQLISNS